MAKIKKGETGKTNREQPSQEVRAVTMRYKRKKKGGQGEEDMEKEKRRVEAHLRGRNL